MAEDAKKLLSICIPSKRNFAESAHTMQSATDFCKRADAQCVVSDNSQDPQKEKELKAIMPGDNFRYIKSLPCDISQNFLQAFNGSDAEFVLMMGDDDRICHFGDSIDFSNLSPDIVGIKPSVFAYAGAQGIVGSSHGPLTNPVAVSRIVDNGNMVTKGCNLTFYSFWRRSVLQPLMELWFTHHPTKGIYCDWAIMQALVSSGRVITHPSAAFFYNIHNWIGDRQAISVLVEKYFLSAGLPAGSSDCAALFNAVDSFIFINRKVSPLKEEERGLAAIFCFDSYLKSYIKNLPLNSTHENKNEILKLSGRLDGNSAVPSIFALTSEILSAIKPGLGKQYEEFYQYAANKPWGTI